MGVEKVEGSGYVGMSDAGILDHATMVEEQPRRQGGIKAERCHKAEYISRQSSQATRRTKHMI